MVRAAPILALMLAAVLLAGSVGIAVRDRTQAQSARDHALRTAVDVEQSQLAEYFSRARSIDLITADNPAFRGFYAEPGSRTQKIRAHGRTLRQVEDALVFLEQLYPGAVGEACFIDRGGAENARAVKGFRAGAAMLSSNERHNPFFAPTFSLRSGEVYQALPYISPDTQEWVISNSTPLPGTGFPARAIVHYEITVESLRKEAAASAGDERILVVDARDGSVVVDSGLEQVRGAPLGQPDDHRFARLVRTAGTTALATVGGSRIAYRRLPRDPHNANDWLVVAESPRAATGLGLAPVGLALAGLALLLLGVVSLRASRRALRTAAFTDALTGLANRRALLADLEAACARATSQAPCALVLYDLDGFKRYNDTFGHLPGDALLARLGGKLERALGDQGRAYRLGGDEFCVLAPLRDRTSAGSLAELGAEALAEAGEGFAITASFGVLRIPDEGREPGCVLEAVDARMYAAKQATHRPPAEDQIALVPVGGDLSEVCALAARVGHELGLPSQRLWRLRQAAELHDIGKVAIPDAVLEKPGPLDEDEWRLVREHTIIGARLVATTEAMGEVAAIVRSSHERFDGSGYPDRLAGDEIPLEARVVAAADAYCAMTADRAYQRARSSEGAVDELRRCAGSQFDPIVVNALVAVIAQAALAAREAQAPEAAR